jgi:hypothetical protein
MSSGDATSASNMTHPPSSREKAKLLKAARKEYAFQILDLDFDLAVRLSAAPWIDSGTTRAPPPAREISSRRIFLTLIKYSGVRNEAANQLGISVATLRRRLATDKQLNKCWKIVADRFRKPEPVPRQEHGRQPQFLALAGESDIEHFELLVASYLARMGRSTI